MTKVDIVNLIGYNTGKSDIPETLNNVTPAYAVERIIASCKMRGLSFKDWSAGILQHCMIPPGHPYRALLKRRKVAPNDPLWLLGAVAYGTRGPWIAFRKILWKTGREDFPDKLESDWIVKQATF